MSKPVVNQQEIFNAIQALVSRGESPTGAKVRVQLGNRGNANTILKGIHAWYEDHGELMVKAITDPTQLAAHNLKKAVKQSTADAFQAFSHEYNAQITKLEELQAVHQTAVEQFQLDKANIEAIIPLKDERIADLQTQLTEAKDESSRYKSQSDLERIMVADLEAQVTRLMHQNNQDALKHELQHTHNSEQIQALQDALNKAQLDNQKLHEQVVSLEQQTAIAQSNLVLSTHTVTSLENTVREANQTHKAEIDYLREQLASSHVMFETISTHHKLTQTSMQELATTLHNDLKTSTKQTQDVIQTNAKKTKDHLDNLTTIAASTTKQLNEIERKVSHLKPTPPKSKPDKQTPSD